MTTKEVIYRKFEPRKAKHLWRIGYGSRGMSDSAIDIPDTHMLQCPDGGRELSIVFGAPCLVLGEVLLRIAADRRYWVSAGSIVLMFDSAMIPQLKSAIAEKFGDRRPMYALKCDRSSVAAAIRGYRRRRDKLMTEANKAQLATF